jgi:hypothetical protein
MPPDELGLARPLLREGTHRDDASTLPADLGDRVAKRRPGCALGLLERLWVPEILTSSFRKF